jgi:hypothetical protein
MSTTNSNLTPTEHKVAKNLGIRADTFAAQKVAQHTRDNTAGPGEDATRTVFRALGIEQDSGSKARATHMAREGSGDTDLKEKLDDLIHHIGLASEAHIRRGGRPSSSLLAASRLACSLRDRLNEDANGDSGLGATTAMHARMPFSKIR